MYKHTLQHGVSNAQSQDLFLSLYIIPKDIFTFKNSRHTATHCQKLQDATTRSSSDERVCIYFKTTYLFSNVNTLKCIQRRDISKGRIHIQKQPFLYSFQTDIHVLQCVYVEMYTETRSFKKLCPHSNTALYTQSHKSPVCVYVCVFLCVCVCVCVLSHRRSNLKQRGQHKTKSGFSSSTICATRRSLIPK